MVSSLKSAIDLKAELNTLEALARDHSRKSRSDLARAIVRMFDRPELFLSVSGRTLVYDLLRLLVTEIESAVRREIAAAIHIQHDAPRSLVRVLANDDIDVAFPVLSQSKTLTDEDLIEIVRSRTIEHHLAIVDRPSLGASVSEALVETGNEEVVGALLRNKSAAVSPKTMEHLVDLTREVVSYRGPILNREELSSAQALRMFFWVSTALCDRIMEKFSFDRSVVDKMVTQLVRNEIRRVAENKRSSEDIATELKILMRREGRLSADMLIFVLREGEIPMFVTMFGKMTKLDELFIGRILNEKEGKGLAVACRSSDIGRIAFISIFALVQKMRAESEDTILRRLPAALEAYDLFPPEAADGVLEQWRQGADYASSLRTEEYKLRNRAPDTAAIRPH